MKIYLFIAAFMVVLPTQVVLCRASVDLSTTLTVARDTVPDDALAKGEADKERSSRNGRIAGYVILAGLGIAGMVFFAALGLFFFTFGEAYLGLLGLGVAILFSVLLGQSIRKIRSILNGETKKKRRAPSKRME